MVCVPLGRPAPDASRRRFLNCGHKSLVDCENNFVGYSYHLERSGSVELKYGSVELKIDGCVVCDKLRIVL